MEIIYHYPARGSAYCKYIASREHMSAFASVAVRRVGGAATHLLRP
jgi:hypothetical protein